MDVIPKNNILQHNSDTLVAVRQANGFCEGKDVKEVVDALEKWIKEQNDFTKKDFSRHYLETTIISAKGSLDRAKFRLKKACNMKTTLPHFFGNFDIRNDFKEFDDIYTQVILPKLTRDQHRVYLFKNAGQTFQSTVILQIVRMIIMFLEYLKEHDYSDGLIIVVDLREASVFEFIRKMNLNELKQGADIVIEGFGTRLKGIHMISSSRVISVLVWLVKRVLSAKVAGRVHVHQSPTTLHEFVPKEIFPKEYDGDERSFQSLHEEWQDVLSSPEVRSFIGDVSNAKIDQCETKARDLSDQPENI